MPLHHLIIGQPPPARAHPSGPCQGLIQGAARKAQGRSPNGGAEHIQHRHGNLEPLAGFSDQRTLRQHNIVEPQMRQRMRRHHLDPIHHPQAGRISGQQKRRQPFGPRPLTRAGDDHINIGNPAIRDIGLLPVQDPTALAPNCSRGGLRYIRPRPRLGQRKAGNRRARPRPHQPFALLGRAKQRHRPHAQPLHGKGKVGQPIMARQGLARQT